MGVDQTKIAGIKILLDEQLLALHDVVERLSESQYVKPVKHLSGATIGEHCRHILEMIGCLENGIKSGEVDYFYRIRNLSLQQDRSLAITRIKELLHIEFAGDGDISIKSNSANPERINTTVVREWLYLLEHTIHHLALIRVGLIELNVNIIQDDLGVSYATRMFKATTPHS